MKFCVRVSQYTYLCCCISGIVSSSSSPFGPVHLHTCSPVKFLDLLCFCHRWEDNIKMDLQEVDGEAWAGLIWLRIGTGGRALVNAVMNLWVP